MSNTTRIAIEVPERISLNIVTGQSQGTIPWNVWHELKQKLEGLELQAMLAQWILLFARMPELAAISAKIDPDWTTDDQGGTFRYLSRPFWFSLSAPVDRVINIGDKSLDFTGIGMGETIVEEKIGIYFEDMLGNFTDALLALDDENVSKVTLNRADIAELLSSNEVNLDEVAKRLIRE
ncbi:MAG: hypothetical protein ING75_14740 [Rhodocyclaceae bacterium]|nr:hypothetical protein [Rhodocyclaceae bacterium]